MTQDEILELLATARPLIGSLFGALAVFGIIQSSQEATAVNLTMATLGSAVPFGIAIWALMAKRTANKVAKDTTRVAVATATNVPISSVSPEVHTEAAATVAVMRADGGVPEHAG